MGYLLLGEEEIFLLFTLLGPSRKGMFFSIAAPEGEEL